MTTNRQRLSPQDRDRRIAHRAGRNGLLPSALCLFALSACAHSYETWPYPGWQTIESKHFHVHGPRSDGLTEIASELERIHSALTGAFFPQTELHHVEVLVFSDDEETRKLPSRSAGILDEKRADGGILVMTTYEPRVNPRREDMRFSTPNQEKAVRYVLQRFLRLTMADAPLWFRQGLTHYIENVQLGADSAVFGHRDILMTDTLRAGRAILLGQLVAATKADFDGDWGRSHHASAWAFIHYLLGAEKGTLRPKFDALCKALLHAHADAADSRAAIEKAFDGMPFEEIEHKVRDYAVTSLGSRPYFHPLAIELKSPDAGAFSFVPADAKHVQNLLLQLKRR